MGLLQLYPECVKATQEKIGIEFVRPGSGLIVVTKKYSSVVAIHGLGGHRIISWTHEDGNMWLKDQLPMSNRVADLNPRILTFGYDARFLFTASVGTLQDYALQLLAALHDVREQVGIL